MNALEKPALDLRRERLYIPDDPKTNVVGIQAVGFVTERLQQQTHQKRDLFLGTLPVLRREGVQRQIADTQLPACADDVTDRLNPLGMPADPGSAAASGPAPVPIHDDRDMSRNLTGGSQTLLDFPVPGGRLLRTLRQRWVSPLVTRSHVSKKKRISKKCNGFYLQSQI